MCTLSLYVYTLTHILDSSITKYLLLFSVLFSYSYVITTSIQSILMWISISAFAANTWCPLFATYRMFSYVAGRILLYTYFIYRCNDVFRGTYLEFSKFLSAGLVTWCPLAVLMLVIPSGYIYHLQHWTIHPDTSGNGTFCVSDDKHADYIQYLFMYGSLNDLVFAIVTILMMVSRLFLLLTDNERKKSKTQKYEYRKSMHARAGTHSKAHVQQTSLQMETEPDAVSAPPSQAGSPRASPRGTPQKMFPRQISEAPELMRLESQDAPMSLPMQQNMSHENPQILHVASLSMEHSKSGP